MIPFLLALVLTEALVELVVGSELLAPVREGARARSPRAGIVLACGYCLSVWVAVALAYVLDLSASLGLGRLEPLVLGLAVHRLSNLWHEMLQRALLRLPFQLIVVRRKLT